VLNASKCSESIRCSNASAIGPCTPLVSDKNKTFHFRRPPILSAGKQESLARRIHFFVALAQRAKQKKRVSSEDSERHRNEPPRPRTKCTHPRSNVKPPESRGGRSIWFFALKAQARTPFLPARRLHLVGRVG